MSLYLADDQAILNGTRESRTKSNLAQLNKWNDTSGDLILQTPDGKEMNVVFLPGTMRVDEHFKEAGRTAEYTVNFLLAEV